MRIHIKKIVPVGRWIYSRLKLWQWLCVVLGMTLYGAVAYIPFVQTKAQGLHSQFMAKTGLQVKHLLLEGRKNTDTSAVVAAIGLKNTQMSIFSIDVSAIQQRLENLGWVKNASVSRIFPDTLYVVIQERVPVAVLQRQGIFTLIDIDGFHISNDNIENFADLKVLIGDGVEGQVAAFFDLISTDERLASMVTSGVYVSNRRWDIILQGGIRVQMPAENPEQAWQVLRKLAWEKDVLARPIVAIDLRVKGRVNMQIKSKDKDKST